MDPSNNVLSVEFLEGVLDRYAEDPASVEPAWRDYFDRQGIGPGAAVGRRGPGFRRRSVFDPGRRPATPSGNGRRSDPPSSVTSASPSAPTSATTASAPVRSTPAAIPPDLHVIAPPAAAALPPTGTTGTAVPARALADVDATRSAVLQHRLDQLIRNYRVRGHMMARLDPLGMDRPQPPELDPKNNGFTDADLDVVFATSFAGAPPFQTLSQILSRLRNTYCRSIGVQFMHIDDLAVRQWLQQRMESTQNHIHLPRPVQQRVLKRLSDAVLFEEFVQRKYVGAKSFSLEGAETLIPLLDLTFERAGEQGVDQVVLAMAHRGRLNVLANIMGKPLEAMFREFEGNYAEAHFGSGDVKYHLGHSSDWATTSGRTIHLSLCFNPSHLEFINPVALGRTRAKQDRAGDVERRKTMCLLIHGDAAFAGEGVVQETLNLSELPGYRVGGTVHVVINNQIGFTTGASEGRSSVYCTDVAKMLQVPIFHVNGEDPEAVAQVVSLALEFRDRFHRDVVIDMYCYRRRGHNEGDEPSFTQPLLYNAIRQRPSVREVYLHHLSEMGGVTHDQADRWMKDRTDELERALASARRPTTATRVELPRGIWSAYTGEFTEQPVATALPLEQLTDLLGRLTRLPEGFTPHAKLQRWLQQRRDMAEGKAPLDWAAAEALALAGLVCEGRPVRLTGQDTQRGTFTQRHAVLHDSLTGVTHCSLAHLQPGQAAVELHNSPLSEAGVLGFEYGYSLDMPEALVGWEAQFGDFCNAAQVIIDQFITSAQDKWNLLSGLVLLLPHGFEGQGPEHSSARLERWLVLGAENNIRVAYPSTPAQYFHLLRQQVVSNVRVPLVVMTPKSLLRDPQCTSPLNDLSTGTFEPVLRDPRVTDPSAVKRVILCSGKVYYDLRKHRDTHGRHDVAIHRIERLYPLPIDAVRAALDGVADGTKVVWVQEEPRNMGAWPFLAANLGCHSLFQRLPLVPVSRQASASPATGSSVAHKLEQEQLIVQAFGGY